MLILTLTLKLIETMKILPTELYPIHIFNVVFIYTDLDLNQWDKFRFAHTSHSDISVILCFHSTHNSSNQSPKGAHPYPHIPPHRDSDAHTHSITSCGCRCLSKIVTLQAFNHRLPHCWVPFRPFTPQIILYCSRSGVIMNPILETQSLPRK